MHYLIDGYNLLFRSIHARESEDLKLQRQKIIREFSKKLKCAGLKASIIFDAHMQVGLSERFYVDQLLVHFTDEGETADEYIIETVRRSPNPKKETVVTSDGLLAWRVRRKGGNSLSVDEFQKMVDRIYKKKLQPQPVMRPILPTIQKRISLEEHYEKIFEAQVEKETPKKKKFQKSEATPKSESDYERWLKAFEGENGA